MKEGGNKYKVGGTKYKLFKVVKLSKENCRKMYNLTNSYKILVIVSIYLHISSYDDPEPPESPHFPWSASQGITRHQERFVSMITSYPHNEAVR